MQRYHLTLIILSIIILSGCSYFTTKIYMMENYSHVDQILYDVEHTQTFDDYNIALKHYIKFETELPFNERKERYLFYLAFIYYKKHDLENALTNINKYIFEHPRSDHMDHALYLRGLINLNMILGIMNYHITDVLKTLTTLDSDIELTIKYILRKDISQRDKIHAHHSIKDFITLVNYHYDSIFRDDAIRLIIYIDDVLARHESNIFNYYMRHNEHLAAFSRSKNTTKKYSRTHNMPESLYIAAKAYKVIGNDESSDDILQILNLNYPSYHMINIIIDTELK